MDSTPPVQSVTDDSRATRFIELFPTGSPRIRTQFDAHQLWHVHAQEFGELSKALVQQSVATTLEENVCDN